MADTVEKREFQAEVREVLDIVIHSLYTHKEIFLRELISNASDAIDKRRYEALTKPELFPDEEKPAIVIEPDKDKRTLLVRDNGIGMSKEELVEHLGTIAKSGTKDFARLLRESKSGGDVPGLIGKFGVGFYSTFMVADTVAVTTRKAGEGKGHLWRSQGSGGYSIEEAEGAPVGTSVLLSLKKIEKDEFDCTDEGLLTGTIKKYSDFITYPIRLKGGDEAVNSMKAIWTKPAKEITVEEHSEFYKHVAHDWNVPLATIRFSAEGTSLRYDALLYLPGAAGMELFQPERRGGVQFYVNRVMIMEDCKELTPDWLRFVRGVIDCPDVSLNISRESMQQNRQVAAIRKRVIRKVLDALKEMQEGEKEKYLKFWAAFGKILKEGLYQAGDERERLTDLVLFETSAKAAGELSSFKEYVERMKAEQKDIYYIAGESRKSLENSPYLEELKARGYEVIFFTDPVDEVVVDRIEKYSEKPLRSAGKGDIGLEPAQERKELKEKKEKDYKTLLEYLQKTLSDYVKEVRFSDRLTESAVCLVADEQGMSARLERIMRQNQQQALPANKRIMEINPGHAVVEKMKAMFDKDPADARLADFASLLYGQGALTEGSPLPDPPGYAKLVARLMAED